jgi:NAD+ synthase (glutamine-hydrolysing)
VLFDGSSRAVNPNGEVAMQLPEFKEATVIVEFENGKFKDSSTVLTVGDDSVDLMYRALVFGVKDYFQKMGFKQAILGSSGGMDSALVQTICSDALGPENVTAVLMPSKYSSDGSVSDAEQLSKNLKSLNFINALACCCAFFFIVEKSIMLGYLFSE